MLSKRTEKATTPPTLHVGDLSEALKSEFKMKCLDYAMQIEKGKEAGIVLMTAKSLEDYLFA